MRLSQVELRRVQLPFAAPFRSSQGTETSRDLLLLHIQGPDSEGWGECAALATPHYSSETVESAHETLKGALIPLLEGEELSFETIHDVMAPVPGHPMAKATLESALWDAELRSQRVSLAGRLGATRTRVPAGVAVGLGASIPDLLTSVSAYVDAGYLRVKLKIEPGSDIDPVRAVREAFPDLALQVDANMAYSLDDCDHLARLDPFDLLMIEQPLPSDDLDGHAKLAGQIQTPICLDESITSTEVATEAIERGACSIINIKPGRLGGLSEAVQLHDYCLEQSIPAWCGGMLESGLGRAVNLALAALPGFTMVGDLSASSRYFHRDITPPFELREGHIDVPAGSGIGVEPIPEYLDQVTISTEVIEL